MHIFPCGVENGTFRHHDVRLRLTASNIKPNHLQQLEACLLVISALFLVYVGRIALISDVIKVAPSRDDLRWDIFQMSESRYNLSALTISSYAISFGLAPPLYAAEPSHEMETISVYASTFLLQPLV
ncbi:hypothetical protein O9993_15135 [Vibrio lentus]|nr:hypothetical protein [Vibrio lentus]